MLRLEPAADSPRALVANLGHAADGAIGLPGALAWSTVLDHAAFTARPCLLWLALAVECSCGRDAERVQLGPNAFSGITKLPPSFSSKKTLERVNARWTSPGKGVGSKKDNELGWSSNVNAKRRIVGGPPFD